MVPGGSDPAAALLPGWCGQWQAKRWATKKQGGSTKNKADSRPKYLGAKMSDGQLAFPGQILVRQRGLKIKAGDGVGVVRAGWVGGGGGVDARACWFFCDHPCCSFF